MKFICIGHATYDTTLPMNEYPKENLKHRIPEKIECGGGPASNAAYLLAKWGMDTTFIGIVGDDYYGEKIIEEFNSIGVHTDYIEKNKDLETDSSYIISNLSNGSRTILTAKSNLPNMVDRSVSIHDADVILVDGEHFETAKKLILDNPNAISIIDAGRVNDYTKELGKMATYLVCSKDFAEEFTNKKIDYNHKESIITIYEELKIYFKTNIIITLEEKGSFTKIEDYKVIPSIPVTPLDSTGAGDIFHGAFTYFIAKGYDLEKTIKLASITGALSVEKIGSRYAIPELNQVIDRYQKDNHDII